MTLKHKGYKNRSIISNTISYSMQIKYFAIKGLNIIKLLKSGSQRRVQPNAPDKIIRYSAPPLVCYDPGAEQI